jgi:predicted flap endonuclease-1-like 5' DNA nuclease
MHMTSLIDIEGVGPAYAQKLKDAGVGSVEELLERGASAKGRAELAEKTQISGKLILKWVNRADLFRLKGVGEEYSDLLELAGVDTIPELAQRNPENLHAKLTEVLQERPNVVRKLPTQAQVKDWVAQARNLPRVLTY